MPRPRIRPEDRQRAVKACIPCKSAKKRCDARTPCAPCIRLGSSSSCLYQDSRRTGNARRSSQISNWSSDVQPNSTRQDPDDLVHTNGIESDMASSEQIYNVPVAGIVSLSDRRVSTQDHQIPTESPRKLDTNEDNTLLRPSTEMGPDSMEDVALPQSRLMLNARGEKVYVGNAAALAFLQFLRQILSQHMGPSQFTKNVRGNVMLEAQSSDVTIPEVQQEPQENRVLLDKYFLATSGILDLYSRSDIYKLLEAFERHSIEDGIEKAIIYIALAIGGQSRFSDDISNRQTQRNFARGRKLAMEGMLEDPSTNLIEVFLLMAFYLLGSCRRNAAFMYIGIAARAAHALGIHEAEPNYGLSTDEYRSRLRIWKSLRILDVMVSSILARPFASRSTLLQPCASITVSRDYGSSKAVDANFELCLILEDVVDHIGQQSPVDIVATEKLLQRLSYWSVSLPSELRLCSVEQSIMSSEHGLVMGTSGIKATKSSSASSSCLESIESKDRLKLADACVDAAIFMAQICQNTLSAGLLLDNMCILKAWTFGAGLVLGFTMFANIEDSSDMESAFASTREILEKFSKSSPQAEHYHEVLNSFFQAITKRREHIAQEGRRATSQYVDQIFVMDFQGNQSQQCITPTSLAEGPNTSSVDVDSIEEWWNMEFPLAEGILDNAPDVLTADWDAFALQIQENFTVDTELP